MRFESLEVGDKFVYNNPGTGVMGTMQKILPEFHSCCTMDANAINLDTGMKFVCPYATEVTKL